MFVTIGPLNFCKGTPNPDKPPTVSPNSTPSNLPKMQNKVKKLVEKLLFVQDYEIVSEVVIVESVETNKS